MDTYHQHSQILNKFTIAQILLTEPVVSAVKRELRKLFPEIKVDSEQITDILNNDILKREVIEGDKVKETQQKIKKITAKLTKQAEKKIDKPESPINE